ncbi:unnamed protein product [Closterium sp. NIES-65]|nr:unnamed protein product [Closterium sp. NIES-65]
MSFLRFRRGSSENSYFNQESELKASKLRDSAQLRSQNNNGDICFGSSDGNAASAAPPASTNFDNSVDVLPEILSHRLPLASRSEPLMDVRYSPGGSGDAASNDRGGDADRFAHVSRSAPGGSALVSRAARGLPGALEGAVGHVPQTRLGRGKYQISFDNAHTPSPSTANERRPRGPDKATTEGMAQALRMVTKSFAIATVIVAGGAAVAVAGTFRALDVQTLEDLPVKGKAAIQPRIDAIAQWLSPLNHQVQQVAAEWQMKEGDQSALGSRFAEWVQGADGKVQGADGRVRGADGKVQGADGKVQGADGKVQGADGKVQGADGKVRGADGKVQGADGKVQGAGGTGEEENSAFCGEATHCRAPDSQAVRVAPGRGTGRGEGGRGSGKGRGRGNWLSISLLLNPLPPPQSTPSSSIHSLLLNPLPPPQSTPSSSIHSLLLNPLPPPQSTPSSSIHSLLLNPLPPPQSTPSSSIHSLLLNPLPPPQSTPSSSIHSLLNPLPPPQSTPSSSIHSLLLNPLPPPQSTPSSSIHSLLLNPLPPPKSTPSSPSYRSSLPHSSPTLPPHPPRYNHLSTTTSPRWYCM